MLQPVQAQAFLTYGNGVVIGNTSITLTDFLDINGNQLVMSNFGTVGTFTIEPNNGTQEEQCIFTGVTANANGTTTLTGISSVGFESPYTQTSGFLKNHAGGTTVALSDTAYLYSQYANLGGTQTFTGTNTFNIAPIGVTPTSATQLATKGYVDGVAIAGGSKASSTVFGISELSVNPVIASVPIAVGQNDPILTPASGNALSATNKIIDQIEQQSGTETFAVATGGSIAFAISLTPTPAGYVKGELIRFQTNVASGTSPTINKNGLGAKSLYKLTSSGTTPLVVGDLGTNQMNVAEYDGGAYQLISPIANLVVPALTVGFKSGTTSKNAADASTTQNIAHGLGVAPKWIELEFESISAIGSGSVAPTLFAKAYYNGTTQTSLSFYLIAGSGTETTLDNTFTLNAAASAQTTVGTITFDATNINIAWVKTGSPTGTYTGIWKAFA